MKIEIDLKKKEIDIIRRRVGIKSTASKELIINTLIKLTLQDNLSQIIDWKDIKELIPKIYISDKMKKTGLTGIFAACLELTKEGQIQIMQKKKFEKVMIKKI